MNEVYNGRCDAWAILINLSPRDSPFFLRNPALTYRAQMELYFIDANSYMYSTCDMTAPSIPRTFGFDDSIT